MVWIFRSASLFILSQRVAAVGDLKSDCDADAEENDMQASVELLQANISRLRSGVMQVEPESVFHHHIPKVAGSSFEVDAHRIVEGSGRSFRSEEGCLHFQENELPLSIVRHPHWHMVSMFRYCIHKRSWNNHIGQAQDTLNPITGGLDPVEPTDWEQDPEVMTAIFEDWLRGWADMLDAGHVTGHLPQDPGVRPDGEFPSGLAVNCYVPVNIQTHRFTCQHRDWHPEDGLSLEQAIDNLGSLWMIGLQEEYDTTYCMLQARATGQMPPGCSCDSRDQLVTTTVNVNDPTASPVISDEIQALIERITSQDLQLYEAAVARFLEDVAAVEAEFGITILCTDDN